MNWKGKRVLITGGTSFIGSSLADAFVSRGAIVRVVDDLSTERYDYISHMVESGPLAATLPATRYDLVYSFGVPAPGGGTQTDVVFPGARGNSKVDGLSSLFLEVFSVLMTYGRGAFWNLDRISAQHSEAQEGCPVTYAYTKQQLRTLVEGVGCRVQDLFVDHIFPWRIPDYVQYRYEKVWHFRILPRPVFRWLETRFGWHLCVTAIKP